MDGRGLWEAYEALRLRVSALVGGHLDQVDEPVPACPGWTVRHVIAHLTGLAQDLGSGRVDGYASDEWTARQVERLAATPIEAVLDAWASAATGLAHLDAHGELPPLALAFGDAVVHEADVRAVLAPGTQVPPEPLERGLRSGVARWRPVLAEARTPPLQIVAPGLRSWWLGDQEAPEPMSVEAPPHELFRALYGRRSQDQVASFIWSGDPRPYLSAGLPYPFRWADRPVKD